MRESINAFTPHEIARNRLAKTLFALCLGIVLFAVTVGQSAREFRAKEIQLAEEIKAIDQIRSRIVEFIEPDEDYFTQRLLAAFDVICLTPDEIGLPHRKPGTAIVYEVKTRPTSAAPHELSRRCAPAYVEVNILSENFVRPIAAALARSLIQERVPADAAIAALRDNSGAPQRELVDILLKYWGPSDLFF